MTQWTLDQFDFHLPEHLIAQSPALKRDESRLMVYHRAKDLLEHKSFADIINYIPPADTLVLNNTKVFPARLSAQRLSGGQVELFLLKEQTPNTWLCLAKPLKKLRQDECLLLKDSLQATLLEKTEQGQCLIQFNVEDIKPYLESIGDIPLPPYIKRAATQSDLTRYQTVYARNLGAVAAPTAGLHFTPELLNQLKAKGVNVLDLTLHVGPGTFKPVTAQLIADHRIDPEFYQVQPDVWEALYQSKTQGRSLWSVGTTSTRVLETLFQHASAHPPLSGEADLFIYPGFSFKGVDHLLTNFHLPQSSLIMLVAALAGYETTMALYQEAIAQNYRFYSYGDAMLIL